MMISVIIPSYNFGHLISDTLNSIISQTVTDWEIIIVDDGSTDNTSEVVGAFTSKYNNIHYYTQSNAGPSAARNHALQYAKGDFVQFLDADDLIEKRKFEVELALFKTQPETDVVYSHVRYFKKDPFDPADRYFNYWGENKDWLPKFSGKGHDILVPALKGGLAHLSTYLFRRELLNRIDKWDADKRAAEDYLYILNCFIVNAVFLFHDTPETYALVRWHANNASRNVNWIREGDRKMRIELRPRLAALNRPDITAANEETIKALGIMLSSSWRSKLLSGGPFDRVKKWLDMLGLKSLARKIFYKTGG